MDESKYDYASVGGKEEWDREHSDQANGGVVIVEDYRESEANVQNQNSTDCTHYKVPVLT